MATICPPDPYFVTAHAHEIALPDRGDGVACALRESFKGVGDDLPADMMALLAAIDMPRMFSARD
jgi:hypothetical protein